MTRRITLHTILADMRTALRKPVWGSAPRPRGERQRGFAYIMALIAVMVMIAGTLSIFELGAVQARRNREAEMIWRGNQYKRAIRLYYHKTGKYPQTMDDLVKGLPQLHFLRQQYKDPTNKSDGAWRFIYVNAAGSIIGSTKYATLQQMQLLDMNGGVMPVIPGQPGISAASLATGPQAGDINAGSSSGSSFSSFSSGGTSTNNGNQNGNGNGSGTGTGTSQDGSNNNNNGQNGGSNITTDQSGQNPAGAPSSNGGGDSSQSGSQTGGQSGSQSGSSPGSQFGTQTPSSGSGMFGPALGGQSASGLNGASGIAGASGLAGAGIPGAQMNLAALAQLKPTGPVDGPVLGGFLTGVAGKTDAGSVKRYHGAKKLNQFEFIWNPLEDAAAALQNQMSNMGGNQLGTGMAGTNPSSSSPNGSSSFGGSSSSPFGNSGGSPSQPSSQSPQLPQNPQQ